MTDSLTGDQISQLIDRWVADAERLFGVRMDNYEKALVLQAVEYERRLNHLNGEHATLTGMRDAFVLREVYNKDLERLYTERNDAQKIAEEQRSQSESYKITAQRNAMGATMGMVLAVVGWGITLLFHFVHN